MLCRFSSGIRIPFDQSAASKTLILPSSSSSSSNLIEFHSVEGREGNWYWDRGRGEQTFSSSFSWQKTAMGREVQQQQQQVSYTVEQLVAFNPYNPDILPDLENYVNEQVTLLSTSCLPRCICPFVVIVAASMLHLSLLEKGTVFSWIWGFQRDSSQVCYLNYENSCFLAANSDE